MRIKATHSVSYELDNHLGSVLTTVSDRKLGVDNNSDNIVDFYLADVTSATDYYAGGFAMPARSFNQNDYRFGHNTQEKVTEWAPGHYTAEFWEYDSRLLRRANRDPLDKPWESPYAAFANNPIWFSDPNGLDTFATSQIVKPGDPNAKVYDPEVDVIVQSTLEVVADVTFKVDDKMGGFTLEQGKEKWNFPKLGVPLYMPNQTPENFEYWKTHRNEFMGKDGQPASFEEVFMSQTEWWNEVGTDVMLEALEGISARYNYPGPENLEGTRLLAVEKYEQWRWHFPARTQADAQLRVTRAKEIETMQMLQHVPPATMSSEEYGELQRLENKYATKKAYSADPNDW